jgi:hypothetical protein
MSLSSSRRRDEGAVFDGNIFEKIFEKSFLGRIGLFEKEGVIF